MRKIKFYEAYLDDMNKVVIYMSLLNYNGNSNSFYIESEDHKQIPLMIEDDIIIDGYHKYECTFNENISFGKEYQVVNEHARVTPLIFAYVVKTEAFEKMFYYDQQDLGVTYTKKKSIFKLWAPTAYKVHIDINHNHHNRMIEMTRGNQGVYEIEIHENLLNASYLFYVEVNGQINKSVDPYAKASTPNARRSVIVDTSEIKIKDYPLTKMNSYCDAIIYEVSIRDYTEEGTIHSFIHDKKHKVLSYIKDLGITHLQILPLLDFKSVDDLDVSHYYNWGYDAHQWMAFKNSFSSNVEDASQILKDVATLITKCHQNNIRVNLDVVFNHVYDVEQTALQLCVPYYYFQYDRDGSFSNSSMCGNDVDSKQKMCHKLIVDSCEYLCKTFKIDGLRFDLMGILDIETMNEVVSVCQAINPDFMVYGEGWDMPSYLSQGERASLYNNAKMPSIAHFSDRFRDTVKGSTNMDQLEDQGYLLSNVDKIYECMNVLGASTQDIGNARLFVNAEQVVNYVECHDNMTSWDKVCASVHHNKRVKKLHHKMMIASVLLAQGIPFIHGGQEFARTKRGLHNTYNVADTINQIDWSLPKKNADMVKYTKELIALRKEFSCLRQSKSETIHQNVSYSAFHDVVLQYNVKDDNDDLIIFINPTYTMYSYDVPSLYEMIYYNNRLYKPEQPEQVDIHGLSIVILRKTKSSLE